MTTTTVKTTEQVIFEMLTENTGRALCDSGDAYGRNWQRNQGKTVEDFRNAPEITQEECPAIDVFHFLTERLTYSQEWQDRYDEFAAEHLDMYDTERMEEFGAYVLRSNQTKAYTVNSYNGEDYLSQVIQYTVIPQDYCFVDETVILLQIHGGADIRGGYTSPKAFTVDEEYALSDNAEFEWICPNDHRVEIKDSRNEGTYDVDGHPISVDADPVWVGGWNGGYTACPVKNCALPMTAYPPIY